MTQVIVVNVIMKKFLTILMIFSFILSFGQQNSKQGINVATYSNLVDSDWKGIDWEPFSRDWNSLGTTSDGQQIADCGIKWARVWVTADMSFARTDAMLIVTGRIFFKTNCNSEIVSSSEFKKNNVHS